MVTWYFDLKRGSTSQESVTGLTMGVVPNFAACVLVEPSRAYGECVSPRTPSMMDRAKVLEPTSAVLLLAMIIFGRLGYARLPRICYGDD